MYSDFHHYNDNLIKCQDIFLSDDGCLEHMDYFLFCFAEPLELSQLEQKALLWHVSFAIFE